MTPFALAKTPAIVFGPGKRSMLPALIRNYGTRALLITGKSSFTHSPLASSLFRELEMKKIVVDTYRISGEPSPQMIDECVTKFISSPPDVVIGLGGGAALDAGKAIAAMLTVGQPVRQFLEGVGTKEHPGTTLPFIAVPTTSGTGSEATKNAVLSEIGPDGYKRSLRHDNFVPVLALLDPELTLSCPPPVVAASGMDAFTQLLESFVSTKANVVTDALALKGMELVIRSLLTAYTTGSLEARSDMMLAAYLSGITLANAGLGLVHGFASSIGGYFSIPHGVVCSRLMGPCNRVTVDALRSAGDTKMLSRYAQAGKLMAGSGEDAHPIDALLDYIDKLTGILSIPSLGQFGISPSDFERIAAATDNKNNPVALDKDSVTTILALALNQGYTS